MKQLNDFFASKSVTKVLDVGTGPGYFIHTLLNIFPEAEITGVDPDEKSLQEAAMAFPRAEFKIMKGEKIDFQDSTFDLASISMALHHLSDIQKTLKEMQRVVKPGGWIIVNELYSDGLSPAQEVHKRMHHFRSRIDRLNGICHNESFTRKEILQKINDSGLKIELYFENSTVSNPPTPEEISERKEKLSIALGQIKDKPEYKHLAKEIPLIEAELDKYGFAMASRLVVVAKKE